MAQYLPVPGGSILLPADARPDRAFTFFGTSLSSDGFRYSYTTTPPYYEVVVSAKCVTQCSAVFGHRYGFFQVKDNNGKVFADVPTPQFQPRGFAATYTWLLDTGSPTFLVDAPDIQIVGLMPLPPLLLLPGWNVQFGFASALTGDTVGSGTITTIRVPSGPAGATAPEVAQAVTPLLV